MVNCSKCGAGLGFLSTKHRFEDDSVMCSSCFKNWKTEHAEKNKKIMIEYITKYLSNKETSTYVAMIYGMYNDERSISLFDRNSLDRAKERFQTALHDAEISNKSGLSSYALDKILNTTKVCENALVFLNDLEKMRNLFEKKGIQTDYLEIMSLFSTASDNKIKKEFDDSSMEIVRPAYNAISKKLGRNITQEGVIRQYMRLPIVDTGNNFANSGIIFKLLDKFNIKYEQEEVEQITEKIKKEIELEKFEKNLGSSDKPDIGDFTRLNGYEFEEYLKNLFRHLDYAAIQTQLSGDQGADLVLLKNNEKIVVQAKKYSDKVPNKAIQEIVAAKNHYKADRALVVTNSSFTKSAIELALSNDVELWDGEKLRDIIKNLKKKEKVSLSIVAFNPKNKKMKLKLPCPFCDEKIDYETKDINNNSHTLNINTSCPHCGAALSGGIEAKELGCENCAARFDTVKEVAEHVNKCNKRK